VILEAKLLAARTVGALARAAGRGGTSLLLTERDLARR
jgi:hypothetical protein